MTEASETADLIEQIARIICIDPLYPAEIGPLSPDDGRRDPETDAKVALWQLYVPHAEKVLALIRGQRA